MSEEISYFRDPFSQLKFLITGPCEYVDVENLYILTVYKNDEVVENKVVHFDDELQSYIGEGINIPYEWKII
jgi:hypothetical protein